jgi:uncharacterized membrane protein
VERAQRTSAIAQVVERNIDALLARQTRETRARSAQERLAYAITGFAGSLPFVMLHAVLVIAWTIINLGWTPLEPFDPTFVILATVASVEAIFLTSFVLITQNQMQADADRRADLDLQVSLLAEHEVTRLISITRRIAERVGVDPHEDSDLEEELDELERDIVPEQVLDSIDRKGADSAAVR